VPYVYAFADGSGEQSDLLGGKGANLAEMTHLGLPVPPGFIITTEACRAYLGAGGLPDGLLEEVAEHLGRLEETLGRRLGDAERPLLVSVRSGAPISMPGMMDTVLNLGLTETAVAGVVRETGDERFAHDAHRRFVQMYGEIVLGIPGDRFDEDASDLSSADLQRLAARYAAIVEDEAGEPIPDDPHEQLRCAIEAVFRSWQGERARAYRRIEGISDDLGTAVTVQAMVFGNAGDDSATGVAFTRNPSTGEREPFGDWLPNAQGEDVVAGIRRTEDLASLGERMPELHAELVDILDRLERHERDLCDVEFTIERGTLWILQTRAGKRSARAAVRIAVDLVDEGLIDEREAVRRVTPADLDRLLHPQFAPDADLDVLTTGVGAAPGAASGKVTFTADEAARLAGEGEDVILVRPETSPDDVHGMAAARGILTTRGGLVSHAAIVARSLGVPAVVGADEVVISKDAFSVGSATVREGDVISLDGTSGKVVVGDVEVVEPEPDEAFRRLLGWADRFRRLVVRANADTPEDARHARDLGAEGIGLCRTEHMFLGDRVPLVRRMILARDESEEREALAALESQQRDDFVGLLEAMDGLPVTVRLLDPPLHEFLPDIEELALADERGELDDAGRAELAAAREFAETNPMLGTRGVRLGILKPELYRMQVRALLHAATRRLADGGDPWVEVMIPLVVTGQELGLVTGWVRETVAEVLGEAGRPLDVHVGTMIETPRAAIAAAQIAEHAQFFSFGTNDLTQLVFGFSRDDVAARVVTPYLERGLLDADPFTTIDRDGVGFLLRRAVAEGRAVRADLELGVCGEHGGDPDSVAFCHEIGLDYVSCSPFRVPVARLAAARAALAVEEPADG
jgi:pyruvate, orthophosphate dikinase